MLKALMLKRKIDLKKEALRSLEEKSKELEKREAELETAISEVQTDEEREAVEEEIATYEKEAGENKEAVEGLTEEIDSLERELAEEEEKVRKATKPAEARTAEPERRERTVEAMPHMRFFNLSEIETREMFEKENIRTFIGELRKLALEKRAVTGAGLTIPEELIPMLEARILENSKLASKVNMQVVGGTSRQVISGVIPEAVWTEQCGNFNELALSFSDVEIDGFKVGGFIPICNSTLKDSDIALASYIISAFGQSIGYALDKAIVYGTGVKMPLGVVTRLAQTSQPSDYPATARTWVDLHTSNIKTGTGATGTSLFKEIITRAKATKNSYARGSRIWLMNENTHLDLMSEAIGVDSAGAIVAGVKDTMPIIGGEIIELDFIPDGNIVCGFFELYTLAQREGVEIGQSEHVRFLNDQTVFAGKARYDGKPAIAEAFAVFSLTTTAPTTEVTFPSDTANPS